MVFGLPSARLRAFAPEPGPMATRKKNTRKTNNVNNKVQGRPRRSDSDVNLSAVGTRIRKLRGQTTQEEFARGLGISQAQLSKYELGQSAVPLGVLIKLAKKSGGTADWILTGEPEAPALNRNPSD
jgi:DNA-binding transcriptional regulator YiaG